jgi:hypothetical protein
VASRGYAGVCFGGMLGGYTRGGSYAGNSWFEAKLVASFFIANREFRFFGRQVFAGRLWICRWRYRLHPIKKFNF